MEMLEDRLVDSALFLSDTMYHWSLHQAHIAIGCWRSELRAELVAFRAVLRARRVEAARFFSSLMCQWSLESTSRCLRSWLVGVAKRNQDLASSTSLVLRQLGGIRLGSELMDLRRRIFIWRSVSRLSMACTQMKEVGLAHSLKSIRGDRKKEAKKTGL